MADTHLLAPLLKADSAVRPQTEAQGWVRRARGAAWNIGGPAKWRLSLACASDACLPEALGAGAPLGFTGASQRGRDGMALPRT